MPELPEVETVRRGLAPVMVGARLTTVEQRRANLRFPFPKNFVTQLEGSRVQALGRRAKYLIADLSTGQALVMHLGMSGRFTIDAGEETNAKVPGEFHHDGAIAAKHDHVVLHFDNGARVTFNDPRRFGFMTLIECSGLDAHPLLCKLGVEPLGNALHAHYVAERAFGRRTSLKSFLLDQRNIAGLGNIYVCEALYRAGLSPLRTAACLARKGAHPTKGAERLVGAIRDVLNEAIAAGGSSLRDYAQTDGSLGYFQHAFAVYGREGEICAKTGCRGRIKRVVQSGRSSFYCGRCQR